MPSFATFETPLGTCALAWTAEGVCAVQLPSRTPSATVSALRRAVPEAEPASPPLAIARLQARLARHLGGRPEDFSDVAFDDSRCPDFHRKVYQALRAVPAGRTVSYGELATRAGSPRASRAVGQAMAKNPVPVLVPCHRVLAAGGRPGGFSAPGGVTTKAELLALEGVDLEKTAPLFAGLGALPFDPEAAARHLSVADPVMKALVARVGPLGLRRQLRRSPFEALAESIIYQQLNGRAAETIHARVCALFPRRRLTPEALLATPEPKLRGAGLSGNKLLALQDLARKTRAGLVPTWRALEQLSDEEIIARLTLVRGVGVWTVQMLLIFRMGRPDVLPVDDFAVRKAFGQLFKLRGEPDKKRLQRHGERWRPFRTAAAWYLWRHLDTTTPAG